MLSSTGSTGFNSTGSAGYNSHLLNSDFGDRFLVDASLVILCQ